MKNKKLNKDWTKQNLSTISSDPSKTSLTKCQVIKIKFQQVTNSNADVWAFKKHTDS